jgi:plastocyanin
MRPFWLCLFLVLAGCPGKISTVHASDTAPVGTGTLDLLVTDERDQPLEHAVVWALGTHLDTPVPSEPVVIEQEGLEFRPRFKVARRGQTLELKNLDSEVHNVNANDACCSWNDLMSPGTTQPHVLEHAGESVFTCNIHAHMRCTLVVLDALHAFSDASGHARLELPLGARKLRVLALDRERAELELTIAPVTSERVVLHLPAAGPLVVAPEKLPWPTVAIRLGETLDEAVRLARLGRGEDARAAAEEAEGKWFSGSGFFGAVRDDPNHPHLADTLKHDLRGLAPRAEHAASGDDAARDQLARQVEKMKNMLLDIARELPKR